MITIGLLLWAIVFIIFAIGENPVFMASLLGATILICLICYFVGSYKERKARKELGNPVEVAKANLLAFHRDEIEAWEKKWGREHPLRK